MSSLAFLIAELQALVSETKRKHPDIREAAEKSLAFLRISPEQANVTLTTDNEQSQELLRPVFMGCATRNAKVVAISLGSLQRLISLKAIPLSVVPSIIETMNECITQGVDIQLRVLQTLLSLTTNFPTITGDLLGDTLILCFKLQESRIAVVSSTAAATLRQVVMSVFDKVVEDERRDLESMEVVETNLPDGSVQALALSIRDAVFIFEDLCLLTNAEKPKFLRLDSLSKTFALELIESVLTNYHDLFKQHEEFMLLLRIQLSPLLLKTLADKPIFPLTLRSTRVTFLLLKQFAAMLVAEAEVFLSLLLKLTSGSVDPSISSISSDSNPGQGHKPYWMRVLAMEVIRGLCADPELMRGVWERYDAQASSSNIFTSLVTALKRLITEQPALLGVSSEMFGVGVVASSDQSLSGGTSGGYGFDIGSVASIVAGAAGAAVSGVVGMIATESGLSTSATMKLQCIDQLDKADSPPLPESYIYLLSLQSIIALCEGFATSSLPLYNAIVIHKPRTAGDPVVRAPPALDVFTLPDDDASTKQLRIVHAMVEAAWPGLLAALSFVVATNLSNDLFADVLQSYQNVINVAGMLQLTTPRDAFLSNLAKFAIPARVVSNLESYIEPPTPRTAGLSENLGFSNVFQAPGLSNRNLACLMVLITSALFLAGSLESAWFGVLETLQNADYVLTAKGAKPMPHSRRTATSAGPPAAAVRSDSTYSTSTSHGMSALASASSNLNASFAELDVDNVRRTMQRLFDTSKNLADAAFMQFVTALCRLSSEMVDMQSEVIAVLEQGDDHPDSQSMSSLLSPASEPAHRRRVSGIHLHRTLRTGDFGINKLAKVAQINSHRLVYRSPDVAWDIIIQHLITVLQQSSAPHSIRIQAARALDDILVVVIRNSGSAGELQAEIQSRVIEALAQQIIQDQNSNIASNTTSIEIRKMGLETLHQILQSTVHSLQVGWETIFRMLGSVCDTGAVKHDSSPQSNSSPTPPVRRPTALHLGYLPDRGGATLVRIAFESLKLVCDTVATLSCENLRLCINTLGQFGRQTDTNIALTAAGSLLWGVSDSIQAKRKDIERETEYNQLWMALLRELLGLCTDARPEVRVGAIQTLFRAMQLYGATLSLETWSECLWEITFPLLYSITASMRDVGQQWDESEILALQSVGSIFGEFLALKLVHLETFDKAWDALVQHAKDAFLLDRTTISTVALRCVEKALLGVDAVDASGHDNVDMMWRKVWEASADMGQALQRRAASGSARSQYDDLDLSFDQDSLYAFLDMLRCTRAISRRLEKSEWPLDRLTILMSVLKSVLTYPHSMQYRPDVDGLTPVQASVISIVQNIDLTVDGAPSLVLSELSEYVTLPFLASFDIRAPPPAHGNLPTGKGVKRITYIGVAKTVMPLLSGIFDNYKDNTKVYVDGTVEALVAAYCVPIKLKYDCPPSYVFVQAPPLWKVATSCFLQVVKGITAQLPRLDSSIPSARIESLWHHILDVFRGGILADCSAAIALSEEDQDEDENLDRALLASLEVDIIPLIGDSRVPDHLLTQLAKLLERGSTLHDPGSDIPQQFTRQLDLNRRESSGSMKNGTKIEPNGPVGTNANDALPRERFAYWCFDLLFLTCSNTAQDQESCRRRVAALCLPALLARCKLVLKRFVADGPVHGSGSSLRQDELAYVLRKLHELNLWSGSLWAALSATPTARSIGQLEADLSSPSILRQAVQFSPRAHLFYFYPMLCTIASLPPTLHFTDFKINDDTPEPKTANTNISPDRVAVTVQGHDIRALAACCLRDIGSELGVDS